MEFRNPIRKLLSGRLLKLFVVLTIEIILKSTCDVEGSYDFNNQVKCDP